MNTNQIFFSRWQARKEGDRNMRAGLIPSKALQERKIIHERLSMADPKKKCKLNCIFSILNLILKQNNLFELTFLYESQYII